MYFSDVSADWTLKLPRKATHESGARSKGLHVSDLVYAAAVAGNLLDPRDVTAAEGATPAGEPIFPPSAITRMCAGLAWEEWLAVQYRNRMVFHPGEFSRDGVIGSPDALECGPDAELWAVHEFKFSWKSANTPVTRHWYWLAQIQAYCYMLQVTRAFLHVYHVQGDYKATDPQYRVWALEFSPGELSENWQLLNRYR